MARAPASTYDFGDLNNSYDTTLPTGARHAESVTGPILGMVVDFEADGTPDIGANGDGADEDGLVSIPKFISGTTNLSVPFHVTSPGNWQAAVWIDWDHDGSFQADELTDTVSGTGSEDANFIFDVPTLDVSVNTGMRVRIATNLGATPSPAGRYSDGEVEDYIATLSLCGNGVVDVGAGETCDQGGATGSDPNPPSPGDGCDTTCHSEPGYDCAGEPSVCTPSAADVAVSSFAFSPTSGYGPASTTLTAVVTNGVPATATNVTIVFDSPAASVLALSPPSALPTGCTETGTVDAPTYTCITASLAPTASRTYDFPFALPTTPSSPAVVTLQVKNLTSNVGDPNSDNNGGTATYTPRYCGDGVVQVGDTETCDQGSQNVATGDGCDAACHVESGWQCAPGNPSVCQEIVNVGVNLAFAPTHAYQGDASTMTWTVTNGSGKDAKGVAVSITKSANATYAVTFGGDSGCSQNATTITCTYGNVADGATLVSSIVVTPNLGVTSNISQTATVTTNNPHTNDNTATAVLEVDYCGDTTVDAGHEECDPATGGFGGGPNQCRVGCIAPKCGDGILDDTAGNGGAGLTESCDQGGGNVTTGDGCDAACHTETGWQCVGVGATSCKRLIDLSVSVGFSVNPVYATGNTTMSVTIANANAFAAATNVRFTIPKSAELTYPAAVAPCLASNSSQIDCTLASVPLSGNVVTNFVVSAKSTSVAGTISQTATIQSQDNPDPAAGNNAATANLTHQFCGDTATNGPEGCDPASGGFGNAPNQCRTGCIAPTCGDGIIDTGAGNGAALTETCDDGDNSGTTPNAGCSATCQTDPDWSCVNQPSVCTQRADLTKGTFAWSTTPIYDDGETSNLQVSVKNNGPGVAKSVKVKFTRPTELTLGTLPGACTQTDGNTNIECGVTGDLASGATSSVFSIPFTTKGIEAGSATSTIVSLSQTTPVKNPGDDSGATAVLSIHYCGDSLTDALDTTNGEECDEGNAQNLDTPNHCRVNCKAPKCSDGIIDNVGGTIDGHSWTSETCDDQNGDNNDACPDGSGGTCLTATCGDGFVNFKTLVGNAPKEDCDQRNNLVDGDGCGQQCHLEAGYTCVNTVGPASQTCTATCGITYNFTPVSSDSANFLPDSGNVFQFGTSTKFSNARGWVTLLSSNVPPSTTATLAKSVAVQASSSGRAPAIEVDVQTDGVDLANDCLELHVDTVVSTAAGTLRDSVCGDATKTLKADLAVANSLDRQVVVTLVYKTAAGGASRVGALVKAFRYVSDVDGDGINEVKNLACTDPCVDGDHDLYGDVITSSNIALCTGGISTTKSDCNDKDAAIKPNIDETNCTDGIDNNCDTKTDGADQFCFEICGDYIDNGKKLDNSPAGNGADCADPQCNAYSYTLPGSSQVNVPADPFCATPCLLDWTFSRGTIWTEDLSVDDLFEPLPGPAVFGWTTGPTSDATRKLARLNFQIPSFGGVAQRGPAPKLLVDFKLTANTVGKDIFAVCIENKTCQGNTAGITKLAETSTAGTVTGSVDLTPWLGNAGPDGNLDITFVFDTNEAAQANPVNVNLDITRVRLASDIDNDPLVPVTGGYEGTAFAGQGSCDPCWDADKDGYGLQTSPDITKCCFVSSGQCATPPSGCVAGTTNPACFDCNDDPTPGKGANAHPPQTADEGLCGDGIDNNCNTQIDAADATCGTEDCANGADDNGDGAVDCADSTCATDKACSVCELSFEFEKGRLNLADSAGFVPSAGNIFEWGRDPLQYGGVGGWWTVKAGNISLVQPTGPVKATLTRSLSVSTTYEQPSVELVYDLKGAGTLIGLCIDKPAATCDTDHPLNLAWSTSTQSPSSGTRVTPVNATFHSGLFDHAFVPIGKGAHTIVIVFQSTATNVDGLFLDAVRVRSDIDLDGKGEATPVSCDHCIDFDGDGFGTNQYAVSDLSTCPTQYQNDCDDGDAQAYPRAQENILTPSLVNLCFAANGADISDDDCDGLADPSDPDCNSCGDGRIGVGETCDPPSGTDCTIDCQLGDNTRAFVSEIHYPILFGRRSEQWIEMYNPANQDVDVLLGEVKIMACANKVGASPADADRSNCRVVSFVDQVVQSGPNAGDIIPAACTVVGRTAMGHTDNDRYYVIAFGPTNLSDFRDTSVIDAVCDDPSFTLPTGEEWLVVQAAGADLDKIPMSTFGTTPLRSFDDCLFAHDVETVHSAARGRSIVLTDIANRRAPSNNSPEVWCLAGRDQDYSQSGTHYGSPGTAGSCAEVVCDGINDDCDGDDTLAKVLADEGRELAPYGEDQDSDGVCDAEDCRPNDNRCTYDTSLDPNINPCTDDADHDGLPTCADTCFDVDGDGYGSQGQDTSGCGGKTENAICDGEINSNPGIAENDTQRCTNDLDDDCDQAKNCLDSGCSSLPVCAGETCANATVVGCGFQSDAPLPGGGTPPALIANSDDFPVCQADGTVNSQASPGKDKVFKFTAPSSSPVTFRVDNLGSRRYALAVAYGGNPAADDSCSESSCANVKAVGSALCADPATVTIAAPTAGETYTIVMKSQGSCNLGTAPNARFTVVCAENCATPGDEDKDGKADCDDTDCALTPACQAFDQDGDGVSSADEITCLCAGVNLETRPQDCTAPQNPSVFPSEDDITDVDGDHLLNCVDSDDDGDQASDVSELASCRDAGSKNNKLFYPTRDLCTGPNCGPAQGECCQSGNSSSDQFCHDQQIDANCNGAVDTTEAASCGTRESNCGDNIDDDFDGSTDCADFDCVRSTLCGNQDVDGDCVSNRVEVLCNTNPTVAGAHQPGVACANGAPGCVYSDEARFKNDDGSSLSPDGCPIDLPKCEGKSFTVTASDDTLTFVSAHGFSVGELAVVSQLTGANGLSNSSYYVQAVVSPLKLKLALTAGGSVVNVTSDGSGIITHACITDDIPNCADDDDDGDFYGDVQETICGSDPTTATSLPPDLDGDRQCDDVDPDVDGDGFDNILEINCALDAADAEDAPRNPLSTPLDVAHDIDDDGTCNNFDDDDDGDGWPDITEKQCGTDPLDGANNPTVANQDPDDDKLCNILDSDDDGDTWSDIDEGLCQTSPNDAIDKPIDTDNDRQCDLIDTDDDNDGVDDTTEIGCHTDPRDRSSFPTEGDAQDPDGDGLPNCIDDDDDGDKVKDADEKLIGSDPLRKDTDGDGIDDGQENANHDSIVDPNETSPTNTDSDGDGIDDLTELTSSYPGPLGAAPTLGYNRDSDGDGLLDGMEDLNHDGNLDSGETNPLIADSDGDGFSDGDEVHCATDPLRAVDVPQDKDQNGECDGAQVEREDCDHDGVADGVETFCGFGKCDAASTPSFADLDDTDGDGDINCVDNDDDDDTFTDAEETICGTKPRDVTSRPSDDDRRDYDGDGQLNCIDSDDDNDGLSDIKEAQLGTNPQDQDTDDDGLNDGREVDLQTNPKSNDSDNDGLQDGTELGVTVGTDDTGDSFIPDADPTTTTQARIDDSDGDGVVDGVEDANHNGKIDEGEGDPNDPTDGLADTDNDGLIDRDEKNIFHTDPNDPDTDDDGLDDKLEVSVFHTDPLDPDSDDGGVQDGFEVENHTDPTNKDDDYTDAQVTGDNVFGCGSSHDAGVLGFTLAVAGLVLAWRRREAARGTRGSAEP
ncbi:MAG: GEVED domain-containing protein [Myxococcota bacterium]